MFTGATSSGFGILILASSSERLDGLRRRPCRDRPVKSVQIAQSLDDEPIFTRGHELKVRGVDRACE